MSASTRDKIISYLGRGIQQSVVASSCGVTPAYVSQLLELPEVREEIAKLQAGELEAALKADASIERVESQALRMIESKLPFVKSAAEAAKVFSVLNSAKRKAATGRDASDALAAQQVIISVPKGATLHFKLNQQNQVVEVEGRTMAPLPSNQLAGLQKRLGVGGELEVSDVASKERVAAPSANAAVIAHRERTAAADTARATEIIKRIPDMEIMHKGVRVVI